MAKVIEISIHNEMVRKATSWYLVTHGNLVEPDFRLRFEEMFNCAVTFSNDIPVGLKFFTKEAYVWFLLRWK